MVTSKANPNRRKAQLPLKLRLKAKAAESEVGDAPRPGVGVVPTAGVGVVPRPQHPAEAEDPGFQDDGDEEGLDEPETQAYEEEYEGDQDFDEEDPDSTLLDGATPPKVPSLTQAVSSAPSSTVRPSSGTVMNTQPMKAVVPLIDLTKEKDPRVFSNASTPKKMGALDVSTMQKIDQLCNLATSKLAQEEKRLDEEGPKAKFRGKNYINIPHVNMAINPNLRLEMNHKYYTLGGKGSCNYVTCEMIRGPDAKSFFLGLSKRDMLRLCVAFLEILKFMQTHPVYHNFPW